MKLRSSLFALVLVLMSSTTFAMAVISVLSVSGTASSLYERILALELEAFGEEAERENQTLRKLNIDGASFYRSAVQRALFDHLDDRSGGVATFFVVDDMGALLYPRYESAAAMPTIVPAGPGPRGTARLELALPDGTVARFVGPERRFEPWNWTIYAAVPEGKGFEDALRALATAMIAFAAGLAVTAAAIFAALRRFTAPIEGLATCAERMGRGDLDARAGPIAGAGDEVAVLAERFDAMADRIRKDQAGLEAAVAARTAELEESLRVLRETRDDLMEKEKLAGIGALVAGVAHEVNTPLGISITAASYSKERIAAVGSDLDRGALTKSALDAFFREAQESADIVLKNLDRARQILTSFKLLAADQQSGARMEFDLVEYVESILISLHPLVKGKPVQVDFVHPPSIRVDSYPGYFGQIVTNLMTNAVKHGLHGRASGHIRIALGEEGDDVALSFSDDGEGMDAETRDRAFEPFFTTKRQLGGSGLGLSIVRAAVQRGLDGTVRMATEIGKGTAFEIRFPRRSPSSG